MSKTKTYDFKEEKQPIAVTITEFTLLKKADFFLERYSEPYIVSMAIDEAGLANPAISFNTMPFPNMRKGDTITFDGQGHLIYGPKYPGSFVTYSILFMESDADIREAGKVVEEVVKSEAVDLGLKTILQAQPTYGVVASVLQKLTELVSKRMQNNKDDELYRRNGTLLRDVKPPYDILRTYVGENDFIRSKVSIIPLEESNGLGSQVNEVSL
ncbi:MAG: hypothetical protein ACFB0B_22620 [Thermonemataceae bacterium]